jgi:hypothetical protein
MITNLHPLQEVPPESNMISLYTLSRYPRPPPPSLGWALQGHVHTLQISLYRGRMEDFLVFMLDVVKKTPQEETVLLVKAPPKQDRVLVDNEQGIIYINRLFMLKMEVTPLENSLKSKLPLLGQFSGCLTTSYASSQHTFCDS